MNLTNITTKLSKVTGRTGLLLRKKSPEILLATGLIGIGGTVVLACRATMKVDFLIEEHHEKLEKLNSAKAQVDALIEADEIEASRYTDEDYKRDLFVTYVQTGVQFVKVYGPAVTLGLASVGCILASYSIINKRNVALMAAYKAVEEGFNNYRKRVIEEHGEEIDYMYKNGLKAETVVEEEKGEDGKTKKVKKNKLAPLDPNDVSEYAKFFDENCTQWQSNSEYNKMYLRGQQNYHNQLLQTRGHVFLNEVYDALGIPRTRAGSVVGWVLNSGGDNFVDFGVFDGDNWKARDFVNGYEKSILLDFNVDGVIYDLI